MSATCFPQGWLSNLRCPTSRVWWAWRGFMVNGANWHWIENKHFFGQISLLSNARPNLREIQPGLASLCLPGTGQWRNWTATAANTMVWSQTQSWIDYSPSLRVMRTRLAEVVNGRAFCVTRMCPYIALCFNRRTHHKQHTEGRSRSSPHAHDQSQMNSGSVGLTWQDPPRRSFSPMVCWILGTEASIVHGKYRHFDVLYFTVLHEYEFPIMSWRSLQALDFLPSSIAMRISNRWVPQRPGANFASRCDKTWRNMAEQIPMWVILCFRGGKTRKPDVTWGQLHVCSHYILMIFRD